MAASMRMMLFECPLIYCYFLPDHLDRFDLYCIDTQDGKVV